MVYNITNGFLIIVSLLCWCQLSFSLDDHQGRFIISFFRKFSKIQNDQIFQGAFVQTGDELHYFVDPHQWSEVLFTYIISLIFS